MGLGLSGRHVDRRLCGWAEGFPPRDDQRKRGKANHRPSPWSCFFECRGTESNFRHEGTQKTAVITAPYLVDPNLLHTNVCKSFEPLRGLKTTMIHKLPRKNCQRPKKLSNFEKHQGQQGSILSEKISKKLSSAAVTHRLFERDSQRVKSVHHECDPIASIPPRLERRVRFARAYVTTK